MASEQPFGDWLRVRRRQLDLTQQELADRSSCSVVTVRKIEQGSRRPSKQLAELMAGVLQIPAELTGDFVSFARLDPDSTQIPKALQGFGQALELPAAGPTPAHATSPQSVDPIVTYDLPRFTTPFLGRETEIEALLTYLKDPDLQLVSILGPGGMGKSRLALTVADRLVASEDNPFVDGIVFVSLAPLVEPDQIAPTIADNLGMFVDGKSDIAEQLLTYLAHRCHLLIMDNCEHLLDGIGLLVELVEAAPDVTVLATSRERLRLQGEQAYPIQGLGFLDPIDPASDDAMDHPAVRLFRQTAQRAAPAFVLTVDDLPHVARICELVAGMPLGIELSAGWVGMISVADICGEVQRNLDFLAVDLRDLPPRHRSMRAVFDASWRHLYPAEQSVFRQLSVFRGGFTRQAVASVVGATLRDLGHLIYKSLLHYDRARNRYWLHELLQQYGADKLAEDTVKASAVSSRHCDYFIERLVNCWDLLKGEDQAGALAELDSDRDNFRLAWRVAIAQGEAVRLRPAMDTLGFYFEWRIRLTEGRDAFARLAHALEPEESDEARETLVRALAWKAAFLRQAGQKDEALACLDRAEALCHQSTLDASTKRFALAFIAYQRGYCLERRRNERALVCFRQSIELWEDHGDPWWVALGLGGLGFNLSWSNRFIEARERLAQSIATFERYGHTHQLAFLHSHLADSCRFKGDLVEAHHHAERALQLAEQSGNRKGQADALRQLAELPGLLSADEGERQAAKALSNRALSIYRSLGLQTETALCIAQNGRHRLILGDVEEAERLFLQAMELFRTQHLRQGEGYILRWLALTAATADQHANALEKIERSIQIFTQVGADNFVPHLKIIRYLIDKERQPPSQARPWLAGILRQALEIREGGMSNLV